ncbi:hypothetical protein DM860_008867 [Cuscuta australis]|uniref:Switch 2 n=1 Tax=Cuscuta australis TaxID=267555 RepID=A0A328D7K3_9ASTE|nr:hypothetical protein DM860_008867 [Cuscuta australis]
MSLKAFKEALKPCKNRSSSSSSTLSQTPSICTQFDSSTVNPRKPPKSSLSRQFLRFEDSISCSSLTQSRRHQSPTHFSVKVKDEKEEEQGAGEEEPIVFGKSKSEAFLLDHTGPYEPLVLSPQGETPLIQVPASINCRLLEHQRGGVQFLYGLYRNNYGGVLGDDMGLGKTIQTIAFLAAVYGKDADSIGSTSLTGGDLKKKGPVLVICPTSVIHNWENEFSKWSTFSVFVHHGPNRELILDKLKTYGVEIIITSYDTYRIHGSVLSDVQWEIVVIDEAQRLKNDKSKLYQACLEIKTKKRYGLTGTIMQNKIMELFNLFDWVVPGCLGTREHFREFYEDPLKHGQRSTASNRLVQVAEERKQHLVSVLHKYLLRRTKEETIGHLMLGKEDNVVFCAMSAIQKRVYQRMLQLPDVECLINKDLPCSCGSPLKQVECCKRTVRDGIIWPYLHRDNPDGCDSCPFCIVLPCLVKLQQISNHLELIKPNPRDDPDKQRKDAEFAAAVFGPDSDLIGGNTQSESFMGLSDVKHCGKMRALEKLLFTWISQGDKILLFSYSVRMLDILEKFLIRKGYCFSRLDGSTPTSLRQSLVDDFNSSPSKQVFLISTRAGGLGLNLVSANRVVIFDPNWNPAQDLQAQDRSFRFGQKRHVIVFRLLAAGSLEELIYSRQIYKQQLSNIAISGSTEKRYFEGVQDCKEYQGELFGICNLFRDLSDQLFTSDIIELHGTKGNEDGGSFKQGSNDREGHAIPNQETIGLEGKNATLKLQDLGVVYAHRNEDVVNLRNVGIPINGEHLNQTTQQMDFPVIGRRKSDAMNAKEEEEDHDKVKMRKRRQFTRIAQFMGMEDKQFSKWILSATPAEREMVLQDYGKRKKSSEISLLCGMK